MKKLYLLLFLLFFIAACKKDPKDTVTPADPNTQGQNAQENVESGEELYTITYKKDEGLEDLFHKIIFNTQGKKFEFKVRSNEFCVVLKKSQFQTLSIRSVQDEGSHWSYINVSDYYCNNVGKDRCEIPVTNLLLKVNSIFGGGYTYSLVKAEKRNPNIDSCKQLY